ncbi:M23 family metallopeptidase [Amycolatopsis japonica]|uniref:M23 family metallopeptidase n=1 Tax=Amycolatopsis japonica TaxID=208439 RepID=UPI00333033B9
MRFRRVLTAAATALLGMAGLTITATSAEAAVGPRPNFQLPFPCNQVWNGDNDNSSAHRAYEIDFNRGGSAGADLGDTVVAAAAGKVVISAHQGSQNGFGNLVKIDHGGGWSTYYAHLKVRSVALNAQVAQGQKIGEVGNTSKPGNNISPHLHYEVRTNDSSWPSNIKPAYFNGVKFGYPNANVTSKNTCSGNGNPNPYDAVEVCGDGYKVIDSQAVGSAATAYLLYNATNKNNCVTTIKSASVGTGSAVSAFLEVQGSARKTDSGSFEYYAGPVSAAAGAKCVRWGGSAGSASYESPFEHCT